MNKLSKILEDNLKELEYYMLYLIFNIIRNNNNRDE